MSDSDDEGERERDRKKKRAHLSVLKGTALPPGAAAERDEHDHDAQQEQEHFSAQLAVQEAAASNAAAAAAVAAAAVHWMKKRQVASPSLPASPDAPLLSRNAPDNVVTAPSAMPERLKLASLSDRKYAEKPTPVKKKSDASAGQRNHL